jgi:hypothetical protein
LGVEAAGFICECGAVVALRRRAADPTARNDPLDAAVMH